MKTRRYTVDGKSANVRGMRIGDNVWLHVNGETWVVDQRPKVARPRDGAKSAAQGGEIRSPMPGKILKVNVQVGQKVQARQVLIIMDAMKMEYSLTSPGVGIVKEISVRENQQVELEQVLAKLELEKNSSEG
jgi:acetyl-CoA/propionyl-CoA carboxylase biotin carboxyl carrier protein